MKHEVLYGGAFPLLKIDLGVGETIVSEAGAMVSMTPGLEVETSTRGGFFVGLIRKFAAGESFCQNTYTAMEESTLQLAPLQLGEIRHEAISGQPFLIQATAFLASGADVKIKPKWAGLKGLFGGEGLFWIECSGSGDLFYNAYGHIYEVEVDGEFVVDTGHLVGFSGELEWQVTRVGSWKSTLFSGEGLVMRFSGRGKLLLQTRSDGGLVGWLTRLLPG